MTAYADFLADKIAFDRHYGQPVTDEQINPLLKPHQRRIVQWAVEGGRRAIFAAFGLGKSIMQLETLRLTLANAGGGRAVIVCPLGVRIEFAHDAKMLGIPTRFVRRDAEVDEPGIYVTNYESIRDGRLNPDLFDAVSLDEASVLRSYGSKTYQEFLTLFDRVPYRFVATATPSPNRYKELIHYAGFLGVMDTGQALTRFFQRDSTKANNLTLYPHKEREFWLWLNTWSIFLQSPADIGCPADGYDLPPLDVQWHEVDPDLTDDLPIDRDGQGHLVRGVSLGLKEAAAEKRRSMPARVAELMRIVRAHAAADAGQIGGKVPRGNGLRIRRMPGRGTHAFGWRVDVGMPHAQRREQALLEQHFQILASAPRHRKGQQHRGEIGILECSTGGHGKRHVAERSQQCVFAQIGVRVVHVGRAHARR